MKLKICSEKRFIALKNMVSCGGLSSAFSIDASLGDFILLFPESGEGSLSFTISEDFFSESSENLIKADLKFCYFIYAVFKDFGGYKVVSQKKTGGFLSTVISDNGLKLYLESENNSYISELISPSPEIKEGFLSGEKYVFISDKNRHTVLDSSLNYIGSFYANEVSEKDFTFLSGDLGLSGRKTLCRFSIETGKLTLKSVSKVKEDEGYSDGNLPFIFLESLFYGEDIKNFLSGELIEKKEFLPDFFRGAIGIFPPRKDTPFPMLIYKKCENVYYAKYLSCKVEGGKITEIKLV